MFWKSSKTVARITFWYAACGALWIALSDRLLERLIVDPHVLTVMQTYKGWAFVAFSAALLSYLLSRDLHRSEEAQTLLQLEQKRVRTYLDVAGVILLVIGNDERVKLINRRGAEILEAPENEIIGMNWFDSFVPERSREIRRAAFRGLLAGAPPPTDLDERTVVSKSGTERSIVWHHSVLREDNDRITGLLSSGEDVTVLQRFKEQATCRLGQLAALRSIDLMITSTQDLRVILSQLLDLVIVQFRIDAADVLLVNRHAPLLEYAAEKGFRSAGIRRSSLRVGEGLAGTAALERKVVISPDLGHSEEFLRSALIAEEGFVAYYAVPLIARGVVKGVLELMHRSPLVLDREQLDFLESLASQAAIAIDNAALFDELQRANMELILAYDATLEGWARALDLRDRATERHTERVAELTIKIARVLGVREDELIHIRRGAYLHDVGKIGIPDNILLKEGPLSPDERKMMQNHPVYAFDMLKPITYLRPALDIPYCHHERWDGTGYPRKLKAEQIPLAARIFALADIWDAVFAAGRPYRLPLSRSEACEHIRSLSGTHLDPRVVETFLSMQDQFCPAPSQPGRVMQSA